ncbi:hypothetical protein ACOSP7_019681 [Xanthoceras sorbifolium]
MDSDSTNVSAHQINQTTNTSAMDPQLLIPVDLTSVAKTLNFHISIKLDSSNYIYWKAQVLPAIRALELDDFITGLRACPPKFIENISSTTGAKLLTINAAYLSWRKADQLLLSWLLSTLSPAIMGQVTECPTSCEAWSSLEKLYSQKSMAKVLQLKQQLQNTRKGSESISDYILKIKTLGDGFRAAGQTVSEFDLVLNIMGGLGHDYDPVVVLVSSQHQSMSLEDAQYALMVHEQRLEQLNSISSIDASGASAHFVSNSAPNGNNRGGFTFRGNNSGRGGRGRGRKWNNNNRISCQLCSKSSHGALQCYRRFDQSWNGAPQQQVVPPQQATYNNNQSPVQFHNQSAAQFHNPSPPQAHFHQNSAAYFATPNSVQDQSWYLDSGVTNHITSDLSNLSLKSEYRGNDHLTVGNGHQLSISHFGQGVEEGVASRST